MFQADHQNGFFRKFTSPCPPSLDFRGGESVSHVAHHQAADLPQLGPAASGRLLPKEDAPRSAGGWPGQNGMEHHSLTNLASFSMGISSTKGRSYHCQVCLPLGIPFVKSCYFITPVCCAIQEHETWVLFPYSLTHRMLMRKVATQSDQSVDCCPSVPFLPRPYGFCSLHNVNKASSKRDEMPSFFTAETLKCQPGPAGQIPKATQPSEP